MKVFRVGNYWTNIDRAYADGLRAIAALTGVDPGEPVELEITDEQWASLTPTGVALGDPAPSDPKRSE
jgi:hypothetical protein